jgi:hypothetical protein
MARTGWTRRIAKTGPVDTYLDRWQLRPSPRNRRRWSLYDLQDDRCPVWGTWASRRAAIPDVERYAAPAVAS